LCVEFLTAFLINSPEVFEVAATDVVAGIAATHSFLAHPFKDPWPVLVSFTR
jgi:hypothetical protein